MANSAALLYTVEQWRRWFATGNGTEALPELIGQQASGTVAMVRGEESSPRSIRETIVERLI